MSEQRRQQRTYDHRLRELVRKTGDLTIATRLGVPRSTVAGWLRAQPQDVVTLDVALYGNSAGSDQALFPKDRPSF